MKKIIIDDTYGYEKSNRYYDNYSPALRSERYGLKTVTYDKRVKGGEHMIEKIDVIGNYMPSNHEASRVVNKEGISPTVKENHGTATGIEHEYRIRKLTPRECWRLMDFTDADFDKAKWYSKEECITLLEKNPNHKSKKQFAEEGRIERMSDSQLYKQAGNSICVGVLYYIFKELYEAMPHLFDDLKVSSYFSGIGAFESALDRLYEDINSENFTIPHSV